jgi:predicted HNH restriction endonuclease
MASRAERIISWAAERGNAEAQAEVAERKRRRATRRERSAPRLAAKAEKRTAKNAETAAIRAFAWEFTGGRCLVCMGALGSDWHLHHVVSGGLRRPRQSSRNTVPLCPECHRLVHRNDLGVLMAIRTWAQANGDDECRRELGHRIDKVLEARRAA